MCFSCYLVMSTGDARRTQRPYRYGMILLCCGALINWIGLTENYAEPVRYVGIGCIIAGAILICCAMCCWLHLPSRNQSTDESNGNPVHVITVTNSTPTEKPPAYETVTNELPTYDDAIKLNPLLLTSISEKIIDSQPSCSQTLTMPCDEVVIPISETESQCPSYSSSLPPSGTATTSSKSGDVRINTESSIDRQNSSFAS